MDLLRKKLLEKLNKLEKLLFEIVPSIRVDDQDSAKEMKKILISFILDIDSHERAGSVVKNILSILDDLHKIKGEDEFKIKRLVIVHDLSILKMIINNELPN